MAIVQPSWAKKFRTRLHSASSIIDFASSYILNIGNMGLVHDAAGGTLVNGRSSTATVTDFEGNVVDCLANEIRIDGARRVENLLTASNDFSDAAWIKTSSGTGSAPIVTPNFEGDFDRIQLDSGAEGLSQVSQSKAARFLQFHAKLNTGSSESLTLFCAGQVINITVTPDEQIFFFKGAGSVSDVRIAKRDVWSSSGAIDLLIKKASAGEGSLPTEYIDSDTIYNAGVTGVKYFSTLNGNTVS